MADNVLKVVLDADITKFNDNITKASNKLKSFDKSVKTLTFGVGAFVGAITASTTALFAMANSVAKTGDNFQKMSLRTGLSVEELSRLDFAAKRSGANVATLEGGLRYLTKTIADAQRGVGTAKLAFDKLGISIVDSQGHLKSSNVVLREVSQKLSKMTNETEKISTAQYLFGARFGTQLLPLLASGENALNNLLKKSDELGYTWSTKDANAAAMFEDQITNLQSAVAGFKKHMMVKTFPIWEGGMLGAQAFIQSLYNVDDSLEGLSSTADTAGNSIIDVFQTLSNDVSYFLNFTTKLQARLNIILNQGGKVFAVFSGLHTMLEGKGFKTGYDQAIQEANAYININKKTIDISNTVTFKHIQHNKELFNNAREEYKKTQDEINKYRDALKNVGVEAISTGNSIVQSATKAKTAWHTYHIEGVSNQLLTYIGSLQSKTTTKHVIEVQLKWDGRKIKMDANNPQLVQEIGRAVLQQIQSSRAVSFGVGG